MKFSNDMRRMWREVIFGFACYEGVGDPPSTGFYTYQHAGIVETQDEAERWLEGNLELSPMQIRRESTWISRN